MKRWMMTLAAGYAGIGAVTFLLYRAAYRQTRDVRAWTDRCRNDLIETLDEMRALLDDLRRQKGGRRRAVWCAGSATWLETEMGQVGDPAPRAARFG